MSIFFFPFWHNHHNIDQKSAIIQHWFLAFINGESPSKNNNSTFTPTWFWFLLWVHPLSKTKVPKADVTTGGRYLMWTAYKIWFYFGLVFSLQLRLANDVRSSPDFLNSNQTFFVFPAQTTEEYCRFGLHLYLFASCPLIFIYIYTFFLISASSLKCDHDVTVCRKKTIFC